MKIKIIIILVLLFLSNPINPYKNPTFKFAFNTPYFGKTHFILGYPQQKHSRSTPSSAAYQKNNATTLCDRLRCADGTFKQAFFSPDDNLRELLISLINKEKRSIKAAIFCFTDEKIAEAFIEAKKRGVDVEIITDISLQRDRFNKLEILEKNNIKVFVYNPKNVGILNNIMHNKFVLFEKNVEDKSLLWTGSFNFTKSATFNNQENILIVDDHHLIERYKKQFLVLKNRILAKNELPLTRSKKNNAKFILS